MNIEQLKAIKGVLAQTHGNSAFGAQSILLLQVFENCVDAAIAVTVEASDDEHSPTYQNVLAKLIEMLAACGVVLDENDKWADAITNDGMLNIIEELDGYFDLNESLVSLVCNAVTSFGDEDQDEDGEFPLVKDIVMALTDDAPFSDDDEFESDDDEDEPSPTIDDVEEELENTLFESTGVDDFDDEEVGAFKADLLLHLTNEQIAYIVIDARENMEHVDADIVNIKRLAPSIVAASTIASKAKGRMIVPLSKLAKTLHAAIHGEFREELAADEPKAPKATPTIRQAMLERVTTIARLHLNGTLETYETIDGYAKSRERKFYQELKELVLPNVTPPTINSGETLEAYSNRFVDLIDAVQKVRKGNSDDTPAT